MQLPITSWEFRYGAQKPSACSIWLYLNCDYSAARRNTCLFGSRHCSLNPFQVLHHRCSFLLSWLLFTVPFFALHSPDSFGRSQAACCSGNWRVWKGNSCVIWWEVLCIKVYEQTLYPGGRAPRSCYSRKGHYDGASVSLHSQLNGYLQGHTHNIHAYGVHNGGRIIHIPPGTIMVLTQRHK